VVGNDVGGLGEPPVAQLGEDDAFTGDAVGEDDIEGGEAVGGDDEQASPRSKISRTLPEAILGYGRLSTAVRAFAGISAAMSA